MTDDELEPLDDGIDEVYERIEYGYNRQGDPIEMKDPNETVHEYDYDNLGRQTQDRVTAFGVNIDQTVQRIATAYEDRGLVSMVTSYDDPAVGSGSILNQVAYTYNDFGQLTKDSQSHSGAADGSTPAVSYAYADGSGNTARRTSMTYPNGRQLDWLYGTADGTNDILSRVEALQINGEAFEACTYTYVGLGRYVQIVYNQPGVKLTYIRPSGQPVGDAGDPYTGYDRFGRTVDMRWATTDTGTVRDRFQYGYDRGSNRTWKSNLAASSGQDEHYGYDDFYQVTKYQQGTLNINRTQIGGIPAQEQTFEYDPTGNWDRYTNAEDGTETLDQTRVHNQDNQITQIDGSNSGILYDRAGNARQMPPDKDGDWANYYQLTWDAWNRLVTVRDQDEFLVAIYDYDGIYRRVTKTIDGTATHYYYNQKWKCVEERVGSSTSADQQYVWGAGPQHRDELVLRDRDTDGNGSLDERLYCLMDYYSPTSVINTSGVVQERYAYTAFGVRRILAGDFSERTTSSYAWDFAFHGQFLDEETGYYDYGFRYYSPEVGRWLSRDPVEEDGGANLYRFSANNPLNVSDRVGLFVFNPLFLPRLGGTSTTSSSMVPRTVWVPRPTPGGNPFPSQPLFPSEMLPIPGTMRQPYLGPDQPEQMEFDFPEPAPKTDRRIKEKIERGTAYQNENGCCFYWLNGRLGEHDHHNEFADYRAGQIGAPINKELYVVSKMNGAITYDVAISYPSPIRYAEEVKSLHKWLRHDLNGLKRWYPHWNVFIDESWKEKWNRIQGLKWQFRVQQAVANECGFNFAVYFENRPHNSWFPNVRYSWYTRPDYSHLA